MSSSSGVNPFAEKGVVGNQYSSEASSSEGSSVKAKGKDTEKAVVEGKSWLRKTFEFLGAGYIWANDKLKGKISNKFVRALPLFVVGTIATCVGAVAMPFIWLGKLFSFCFPKNKPAV